MPIVTVMPMDGGVVLDSEVGLAEETEGAVGLGVALGVADDCSGVGFGLHAARTIAIATTAVRRTTSTHPPLLGRLPSPAGRARNASLA